MDSKEIHIADYLQVLVKKKTFIILFTLLFLLVVAFGTFSQTPLYQSHSQLVIEAESLQSPLTGKRIQYETGVSQILDMGTHFRLIKSKPVLKSVIRTLDLLNRPQRFKTPGIINILKTKVKDLAQLLARMLGRAKPQKVLDPATRKMNRLVKQLQTRITLTLIKKTRLINIAVSDPDPEYAAKIANTLAQNYIEYDREKRVASSRKDLAWLNTELNAMKKQLEENEKAFYEYKIRHNVFSFEGKQKMTGQKISEFNTRYLEAKNKRLALRSKIMELERHLKTPKGLVKVSSLINNDLIEDIYNKIGDLEVELSKLLKFYKPKHPKIIQVKSEIDKNQRRLGFELQKELSNLKSEITVVAASETAMEKTISQFEKDALDQGGNELTYSILQRNVKTSQNMYEVLLSRIKESDILKNNAASNISIADTADIPLRPSRPRTLLNLVLGLFFGVAGGCTLAFFFEYMDQTLRTREDVQSYLDIPVLTVIPEADH